VFSDSAGWEWDREIDLVSAPPGKPFGMQRQIVDKLNVIVGAGSDQLSHMRKCPRGGSAKKSETVVIAPQYLPPHNRSSWRFSVDMLREVANLIPS
jgi:hypothetical protein